MRNILLAFAIMLAQGYSVSIYGQDFGNRTIQKKTTDQFFSDTNLKKEVAVKDSYIVLVEFDKIPNAKEKSILKTKGIELLSFHSKKNYWAKISKAIGKANLESANILSISSAKNWKASQEIVERNFQDWNTVSNNHIAAVVTLHEGLDHSIFFDFMEDHGCSTYEAFAHSKNTYLIEIDVDLIDEIIDSPIVRFLEVKQEPDQRLNHENRSSQRVNAVSASFTGGLNLDGSGVVVGIGDGGQLGGHIDFNGRVINEADGTYPSFGAHGDHVAGIVGAGGNLNPRHKGMAPGAELVIQKTSLITSNAVNYLQEHGMVLTNNSYGVSFDCEANGSYNYSSAQLDYQLEQNPELLHVFASGNSGNGTCGDFPQGYYTVLRYYQAAKNVLTVGSTNEARAVVSSSSKGPVIDGRLKPELVGVGNGVTSTGREFDYYNSSGTSMACPSVTGSLALLYQRYKELNNNVNPDGALIKAIACNTADDIHEPGPDFKSGFGALNIKRAVDLITDGNFISGSTIDGGQNTHLINIPTDVKKVKIMLYWHDPQAVPFPDKALVNDLDIEVFDPTNNSYLPWVLDHTPANVALPATRQKDNLNNIEQVTIENPSAGNYAIQIKGFEVPMGPQNYYVVYEYIYDEVELIYPYGEETMVPGSTERIHWDADDTNTQLFNVEFSEDGTNWTVIAPGIAAHIRTTTWTVPEVETATGFIRVVKSGGTVQDQNEVAFNIIPTITGLTADPYCDGYIQLKWDAVNYTDTYEVMYLGEKSMVTEAIVNDTEYVFANNYTFGEKLWFTVRPVLANGSKGTCVLADDAIVTNMGVCPWQNDISVTIKNPIEIGRRFTSDDIGTTDMLNVSIKNVGSNTVSNIPVAYTVNGGPVISENCTPTMSPGDSVVFNFSPTTTFREPGTYDISYWTQLPEDERNGNDSIINIAKIVQLPNPVESLPYKEDFNAIQDFKIEKESVGLKDLVKWDFDPKAGGEIECKLFGNTRSLIMDYDDQYEIGLAPVSNDAIITINLSPYTTATAKVVLDFKYIANYAPFNGELFVRGSDTENWVPLMNLGSTTAWEDIQDVSITDPLRTNGQDFSSSFQMKFSQYNGDVVFDNISFSLADPLPIELSYFKALRDDDDVKLQWATSAEINSDYFEIEMANNFEDFARDLGVVIAKVDAAGNSSETNTYQYLDVAPNKTKNRYYRLKQYDFDGSFTYSDFRVVFFEDRIEDKVAFFPNPFLDLVQFHYKSNKDQEVQVVVTDVKGVDLMTFDLEVYHGEQDISLDLGDALTEGIYLFRVISSGKVVTIPLIKTGR